MKKLLLILSIAIIIAVAPPPAVATVTAADAATTSGMPNYISDFASLLSASERDKLEEKAIRILEEYDCEARIIIVDSLGGITPEKASNDFYHNNGLGYGAEKSCAMLLISLGNVGDRDVHIARWGFADYAYTQYGVDVMLDNYLVPLLREDQFYEAFDVYLDKTSEYFSFAKAGTPYGKSNDAEAMRKEIIQKILIAALISLLIAFGICFAWKSQMKTARIARKADAFIPEGGFALTGQQDMFLYRTVKRTKIESSSGTGAGAGSRAGSSSHSGGGSHSGRKF